MRRLWAVTAAMAVCLALGGLPALAQEASPSGSAWLEMAANPDDTPARVTVEVTDLLGMEGMEIRWAVAHWHGPTLVSVTSLRAGVPIDASPYTLPAGTVTVEPGVQVLVVFAGRPHCAVMYGPVCAADSEGNMGPDHGCATRFDAGAGEVITMRIRGLPISASRDQGA
jgi:hypothetical protein